jgi:hypothetical protein
MSRVGPHLGRVFCLRESARGATIITAVGPTCGALDSHSTERKMSWPGLMRIAIEEGRKLPAADDCQNCQYDPRAPT